MTRWRPEYPPIKKLRTIWSANEVNDGSLWLLLGGALAIDLWRWATGLS
jgi:hypothetical protein